MSKMEGAEVTNEAGKEATSLMVKLPPSKSLSNRALLLSLYADLVLRRVLVSDDTRVMIEILPKLGVTVKELSGDGTNVDLELKRDPNWKPSEDAIELYTENAGTATRFLAATLAFYPGSYVLTGNERMMERPIGDLIEALNQLGAKVEYLNKPGFLPIKLGLGSGKIDVGRRSCKVEQTLSSQYLSAILLVTPFLPGETEIEQVGAKISQSYIELTLDLMQQCGLDFVELSQGKWLIKGGQQLSLNEFEIELDYSAASYWFAKAMVLSEKLIFAGLSLKTKQGDKKFLDLLVESGGLKFEQQGKDLVVSGSFADLSLATEIDCREFPDAAMTLAVLVAVIPQTTRLTGLSTLKHKECDRLEALKTELKKVGVEVEADSDSLTIYGINAGELLPAQIETYKDHRMAMSFAVLQKLQPAIEILDPNCVSKTYPGFFREF